MLDGDRIWWQTVCELAARNESVEVRPAPAPGGAEDGDGNLPGVRLRLLSAEPDGSVVVERPALPGSETGLRPGADVTLLLMVDGQRWEAGSRILAAQNVRLNASHTVRAWRLSPARDVQSAQRRAFFRADTGGIAIKPVLLEPICDGEVGPGVEAHLVNISGGGMGVTIPLDASLLRRLKASTHYRCTIRLPRVEPEQLVVEGELVHLCRRAADLAYLGFTFRPSTATARRHVEDTIVRFTTWLQREQIRHERRA